MGTNPPQLQHANAPVPVKRSPGQRFWSHIKSSMISGLITLVPLFITLYLLSILFGFATWLTKPVAAWLVKKAGLWYEFSKEGQAALEYWSSPALALVLTVLLVYVLGVLSIFTIGRQLLAAAEHFVGNLPLIKGIYGTTKQVIGVFRQGGGGAGFQRVVLVEFPRNGTWTIAFVTNTVSDDTNGRLVCCFIPMTPNPTSGFFQMFPEAQVRDTDWSVDQGIKIVLSGGLLAPSHLEGEKKHADGSKVLT